MIRDWTHPRVPEETRRKLPIFPCLCYYCGVTTVILAVGLSHVVIALAVTLVYVYGFRRRFAGNFWGALAVAVIGTFTGGLVDYLFSDLIRQLSSVNGILNIFPPIIAAAMILSLFAFLSERKDHYD